ncbi:MAG TPA: 5-dehydro-4-deoxy-D-glucuronate isomerase, partial [Caldithrix sp.]|nr:5-dehydro-4-deoxy-D-glucuronate isomerase [Caldithrix sp.]
VILIYTDVDRAIVGSAVPGSKSLKLEASKKEMSAEYFTERREIGVINIGAKGNITVDGKSYELENKDGLYIGRGSKDIGFSSANAKEPAKYYILSYPAHTDYPTKLIKKSEANPVHLGSLEEANKRTIFQYIHENGVKSCQLVMGFTQLESGSIWNTMAAHTHQRRTEIYMYFDMGKNDLVFHFMGKPDATKHLIIRNGQAVLSPSWSLHAGAGTRNYAFIWGMGGENQEFTDMDGIAMDELK